MKGALLAFFLLSSPAFAAPKKAAAPVRPAWTYAKPHFETRKGLKVAVAVGRGRAKSVSLARAAAEDQARGALLLLLQGKGEKDSAEGEVKGAEPVKFFDRRGVSYAKLELTLPAE